VTHPKLGACVDKFELNLLEIPPAGVNHQALAQGNNALFRARDRSLQHEVVILDNTIVRESTHGSDRLDRRIMLGRSILLIGTRADAVNLLVELSAMMVAIYISAMT
jgi:hypothetical protein